jgi:hypothetical protein
MPLNRVLSEMSEVVTSLLPANVKLFKTLKAKSRIGKSRCCGGQSLSSDYTRLPENIFHITAMQIGVGWAELQFSNIHQVEESFTACCGTICYDLLLHFVVHH